jgi:hypothetical protein
MNINIDDGWTPTKPAGPGACCYCRRPVEETLLLYRDGKVKRYCQRDAMKHLLERNDQAEEFELNPTTGNGDEGDR